MQKVLTVKENKVVIDEVILGVPAFRRMYDFYMLKGIDTTILAFSYLHFLYDPESPYIMENEEIRETKVAKDFHGDFNPSFDMPFIQAAEKMKEFCDTPTSRLLMGLKASMDKLSNILMTEDIVSGKDGNLTDIVSLHKQAGVLIQNFNAVESDFRKEVQKRRGNTREAIDKNDNDSDF